MRLFHRGSQDWPEGDYMSNCIDCSKRFLGPKRAMFCNLCYKKSETDYEEIHNSKNEMLVKFNEAKRLAEELGYVLVKKI